MATAPSTKAPPATRRCCFCKKRKPIEMFPANRFKRWGVQAYCRPCASVRQTARHRRNRLENPERYKRERAARYGITLEELNIMMIAAQGDVCAICGGRDDRAELAIDHCHGSGKVRGLLCRFCNQGLGSFRDSPESLRRAALYLEGTACAPERSRDVPFAVK